MATQRLPIPGEDQGNWGEILNDYLLVAHNNDGTLKAEAVILGKADKSYVDAGLANKANTASLSVVAASGSYNDLTDIPPGSDFSSLVNLTAAQTISGEKNFTGGLKISGTTVVATNDARLSDNRTPIDDSVTASKILDNTITEPKLAISNSPTGGDFLSWNGTNFTWQAQSAAPVTSVNTRTGNVVVTKADVGLTNVDNTSDTSKPISTLTQTALDAKANATATQTALNAKANIADLSVVATSGSYSDLTSKPTLSTAAATGSYTDLINKPSFSTVATSGSYADLSNKPTIPTAGTSSSTYAVGDDSRITGALQKSVATTKGDMLVASASATIGRLVSERITKFLLPTVHSPRG